MNRDPCKPVTYCRYCGHLQRIDSKDAIGRVCREKLPLVREIKDMGRAFINEK